MTREKPVVSFVSSFDEQKVWRGQKIFRWSHSTFLTRTAGRMWFRNAVVPVFLDAVLLRDWSIVLLTAAIKQLCIFETGLWHPFVRLVWVEACEGKTFTVCHISQTIICIVTQMTKSYKSAEKRPKWGSIVFACGHHRQPCDLQTVLHKNKLK